MPLLLIVAGCVLYWSSRAWSGALTRRDLEILLQRGVTRVGRVTALGVDGFHAYQVPVASIKFSTLGGAEFLRVEGVFEINEEIPIIFDPHDPSRAYVAEDLPNASQISSLPRFKGNPDVVKLIGIAVLGVGFFLLLAGI